MAVELGTAACATLRANRPAWKVAEGDVADLALWRPSDYRGVALLAGGVPCPPFTVAGRQHVADRLTELGYVPGWRLLDAADFGVPQLRPRTVLVALRPQDAPWFCWPSRPAGSRPPSALRRQPVHSQLTARAPGP